MASTAVTRACPNLHAGGLRIPGCDERPRPAPALMVPLPTMQVLVQLCAGRVGGPEGIPAVPGSPAN